MSTMVVYAFLLLKTKGLSLELGALFDDEMVTVNLQIVDVSLKQDLGVETSKGRE